MVILGSVDVSEHKLDGKKVPNLQDVIIFEDFNCSRQHILTKFPFGVCGTFDCSMKYGENIITKETRFPMFMLRMICENAVGGFDVLCENTLGLPKTLQELIVDDRLIKGVTKNTESLDAAKSFIEKYPNISVHDKKGNDLRKYVEKAEKIPCQVVEEKQPITPIQPEAVHARKTPDWCSKGEILQKLKGVFVDITDADLERYLRIAKKDSRVIVQTCIDEFGQKVVCIKSNCFDELVSVINGLITRETSGKTTKTEATKQVEIVKQNPEKCVKEPQFVQAYMSRKVWSDIVKDCGDDKTKQVKILTNILNINIEYSTTRQYWGTVGAANIEKKRAQCVVQAIDTSIHNDRKRIVWTMSGTVIVCGGFVKRHAESKNVYNVYDNLVGNAAKGKDSSGAEIKFSQIEENLNYVNVAQLIHEIVNKDNKTI